MEIPSRLAERRQRVAAVAARYGGGLSRTQLRALGVDHRAVSREVKADRWALFGDQTVIAHLGPVGDLAKRWRAIWEVRVGGPALDGISALVDAGLTGFEEPKVHVSVAHGWRPRAVDGVRIHHVKRLEGELARSEMPRVRTEIAAVRAAHWARSDRQAALILCMVVQQGLMPGHRLVEASRVVRCRKRRRLVRLLVQDIADGATSLGELDFAAYCRAVGLPEPERQIVRRGPKGKVFLDVGWPSIGLMVEIDGSQHRMRLAVMDDNLRANEVVLGGEVILRMDLVGLRLAKDQFMGQVVRAHRQRSCGRRRSDSCGWSTESGAGQSTTRGDARG